MTSELFVKEVRDVIINENFEMYRDTFFNQTIDQRMEPDYKLIKGFCNNLSEEQKSILFKIIRQVEVETLACFFSMLDGDLQLPSQEGDFNLYIDGNKKPLNEGLVNLLYEIEQSDTL